MPISISLCIIISNTTFVGQTTTIICDMSGTIDSYELMELRSKTVKVNRTDKMMEILSTHPNMLKRVKHLSSLMA